MRKRILYVVHGSMLGGAPISLDCLMRGLEPRSFECVVCSAEEDPQVLKYFKDNGFDSYPCRIMPFHHTTGGHYSFGRIEGLKRFARWLAGYGNSKKRLAELIKTLKPDLVHFNSLTLAPYACVPHEAGIPTVVHVREAVIYGTFGLRRRWLQMHMQRFADKAVYICRDNMRRLGLSGDKAEVIYNPVDFDKFDCAVDPSAARRQFGIPSDARVALFAGGSVPEAKGLSFFLEAMGNLAANDKRLVCLMPSFELPADPRLRIHGARRRIGRLFGVYRKSERLYELTRRNDLYRRIKCAGFTYNIEQWIAASDIVCVPHVKPHFSRTVLEAGAMKKPVLGFRIGGIEEVVIDGVTGLLVNSGDPKALARAAERLFVDKELREKLGAGGCERAKAISDAKIHVTKITEIYEKLLRI